MVVDKNVFASILSELTDAVKNDLSFDVKYDRNSNAFDISIKAPDEKSDYYRNHVTLEGEIAAVDDRVSHIDSEIPEIKNRITELVSELEDHTKDSKHDIKCIDDQLLDIRNRLRMIEDFCLIMCNAISDDKKLYKRFSKACRLYSMNLFNFLSAFSRSNLEPDI